MSLRTQRVTAPKIDLNPSSAERWMTCTASPVEIMRRDAKGKDTFFNQEGTTAHEVARAQLTGTPVKERDSWACPVPVDGEMRWHAWEYAEYVESFANNDHSKILVEQKLPLWYADGRNCIIDAAVINSVSLDVIDYKYGQGVVVSPQNNLQGVIYAYTIGRDLSLLDDHPVKIHIYQPRGRGAEDKPFHTWETRWSVIESLARDIWNTAKEIQFEAQFASTEKLVFKPSKKACQFCPLSGDCEAQNKELSTGLVALDMPAPAAMTPLEKRAWLALNGDRIKNAIDKTNEVTLSMMRTGTDIPGLKLVLSRGGNRYWRDPKLAARIMQKETVLRDDEVFEPRKPIGPAAIEKLVGKRNMPVALSNLISRPPGQPILASEDDERPGCKVDPALYHEKLDTDTPDDF